MISTKVTTCCQNLRFQLRLEGKPNDNALQKSHGEQQQNAHATILLLPAVAHSAWRMQLDSVVDQVPYLVFMRIREMQEV